MKPKLHDIMKIISAKLESINADVKLSYNLMERFEHVRNVASSSISMTDKLKKPLILKKKKKQ